MGHSGPQWTYRRLKRSGLIEVGPVGDSFGLGVAQLTAEPIGTFWFYEGETLGVRALHVYLPESEVIIAIGLNSHPADDQIRSLAVSVYETLMSEGVLSAQAPVGAAA